MDRVLLLAPPEDWPGWNMMEDTDDHYGFPPEDCAMTTPCTRSLGCVFVGEKGPDRYRGTWRIRYPRYLDADAEGTGRPGYTSSVSLDGYIEAAAQGTEEPDGVRPAIRLSIPQ